MIDTSGSTLPPSTAVHSSTVTATWSAVHQFPVVSRQLWRRTRGSLADTERYNGTYHRASSSLTARQPAWWSSPPGVVLVDGAAARLVVLTRRRFRRRRLGGRQQDHPPRRRNRRSRRRTGLLGRPPDTPSTAVHGSSVTATWTVTHRFHIVPDELWRLDDTERYIGFPLFRLQLLFTVAASRRPEPCLCLIGSPSCPASSGVAHEAVSPTQPASSSIMPPRFAPGYRRGRLPQPDPITTVALNPQTL